MPQKSELIDIVRSAHMKDSDEIDGLTINRLVGNRHRVSYYNT